MLFDDDTLTGYKNLLIFAEMCDLACGRGNAGGMIRRLEIAQSMPSIFLAKPLEGTSCH
ncbi:MAG: hypothetical protein ABSB41_16735 [Anaerolineales bacterium]|jgi:hypothetical protein